MCPEANYFFLLPFAQISMSVTPVMVDATRSVSTPLAASSVNAIQAMN